VFLRYRDLLRLLADTTDRPAILGPKERKEILERLRRLEEIEGELHRAKPIRGASPARRPNSRSASLAIVSATPRRSESSSANPTSSLAVLSSPPRCSSTVIPEPRSVTHPTSDAFPPASIVGSESRYAPVPVVAVTVSVESKNSVIASWRRSLSPPWSRPTTASSAATAGTALD
jgi:hypothetical protein